MKVQDLGNNNFFIKFDINDKLMDTLKVLFEKYNWKCVSINSAVGMSHFTNVCQFDLEKQQYIETVENNEVEIITLSGNIARTDNGEIIPHVHGVFSRPNGEVIGGHIKDFTTRLTVEMFVSAFEVNLTRQFDSEAGVKLLNVVEN